MRIDTSLLDDMCAIARGWEEDLLLSFEPGNDPVTREEIIECFAQIHEAAMWVRAALEDGP